jgi:hypothetical protein
MYKGLIIPKSRARPKKASWQNRYGIRNKVHSVQVNGMGAEEYAGPLQQGQTWAQYESWMNAQNIIIGGGIIALTVINPLIGGAALVGWLLTPKLASKSQVKSLTQGG